MVGQAQGGSRGHLPGKWRQRPVVRICALVDNLISRNHTMEPPWILGYSTGSPSWHSSQPLICILPWWTNTQQPGCNLSDVNDVNDIWQFNNINNHTWCESLMAIVSTGSELNAWIVSDTQEQKPVNAAESIFCFSRSSQMVNTFCSDPRMITLLVLGDGTVAVYLDSFPWLMEFPPASSVLTACFSS